MKFAALAALLSATLLVAACDQLNVIPGLKIFPPYAKFRNDCPYARPEHKADLAKNWNGFNYTLTLKAWAKNYSQYVPGLTAEMAKACFDKVDEL
jgi:hypothetical protein